MSGAEQVLPSYDLIIHEENMEVCMRSMPWSTSCNTGILCTLRRARRNVLHAQ